MPNHKLIETLQCFSTSQRKRLVLFVESAYHNDKYNRPKLIQLLQHLLAENLTAAFDHTHKRRLQTVFFPDKPYEENRKNSIDSLASDLLSLIRKFIQTEQAQKPNTKVEELLSMIRFYRENQLENRFWQTEKQLRKLIEKTPVRDEVYYQQLIRLEEEVATVQSIFNTYSDDSNLIRAHAALDNYYTIRKLEKTTVLRFQQKISGIETADALLLSDALLKTFPSHGGIRTPLAELYHLIIQVFEQPDNDQILDTLEEMTQRYKAVIPTIKLRNIMALYRYFMGRKYHAESNRPDFSFRLFRLYKEHLQQGYFEINEKGHILPASLKLMTNFAIKVGEFDWAEKLLKRYPPNKITGTHYPLEAHSLCLAELLFARENYVAAEEHVMYRKFENVNYSILADVLLIKIYYVTQNELLESRVSALGQKVRRTKLYKPQKQQYLHFLRLANQLIKYRWTKPSAEQLNKLKSLAKELTPLLEREWLQQMIATL